MLHLGITRNVSIFFFISSLESSAFNLLLPNFKKYNFLSVSTLNTKKYLLFSNMISE